MKIGTFAVTAFAVGSVASSAFAASTNLSFNRITSNGNVNVATQLKLTVSDVVGQSNKVDFLFKNFVGVESSIKEVYFDAGSAGSTFSSGIIQNQLGSNFVWGSGSPGSLPGGNALTPAFETTLNLLADSGNGGPSTGIDTSSDSLTVRMTLPSGKTYNDVVAGLLANPAAANSIRVGLHVISIGTAGGSDSYVSMLIVPLPAAAWAGMSCLAAVIGAGVVRTRILGRR